MKSKEWLFPVILLVYHLIFALLAWQYSISNLGDAHRYWYLDKHWTAYGGIGTDVIKLINYPFSQLLHWPFWAGFILYSFVGGYAILELYRFSLRLIQPQQLWQQYLLMMIFLLPNLHFWTSVIGKEPIVFLAITWIMVMQAEKSYRNFRYGIGWLLLILIRPHVALFLLMAIAMATALADRKWDQKKTLMMAGVLVIGLGLYLMTMHLLHRNPWDIVYILERNNASLIAFKRAGSYVPMIDYTIIERLWALNFRPFFTDASSLYAWVLSAENFLVLLLLLGALLMGTRKYKNIQFDDFTRTALLFFIIASLFFIQRYSCLGIFVRTKIMYMPFLLIAALQLTQIKSLPKDQA